MTTSGPGPDLLSQQLWPPHFLCTPLLSLQTLHSPPCILQSLQACCYSAHLNVNKQQLVLDQEYVNLKNQIIKAERRVLKELGFCVHVKHPHKIIVMYLQVLECERNQHLVQTAWVASEGK